MYRQTSSIELLYISVPSSLALNIIRGGGPLPHSGRDQQKYNATGPYY